MSTVKFYPTVEEIYSRAEALRWMLLMGWPENLIDSIMIEDCPDLNAVRSLVYRYGPKEAERRIQSFLK